MQVSYLNLLLISCFVGKLNNFAGHFVLGMEIISRLLSAFWGVIGLAVLMMLFLIYANFPPQHTWTLPQQLGSIQLDKEGFFYIMTGAFILCNGLYYLGIKILAKGRAARTSQILGLIASLKVQIVGLNLFLITLMAYLKMSSQFSLPDGSWASGLFYIGPILMFAGAVYFIYWMFKSPVVAD